jgi:phage terminase Nu1 subunit (DNA packaging protein)
MAGSDPNELKLMTLAEVARAFGVTTNTVYTWTLNGCPTSTGGGQYFLRLQDVILWKRNQS